MDEAHIQGDEPPEAARTLSRPSSRGSARSSPSIRSTRTLQSADLTTINENGRAYPNDTYHMPCDAAEQTRLSIFHQLYLACLSGALTTAPISASVGRILDVGSGPGEWVVAMGQKFPYAEVVGVDLAVWELPAADRSDDDEDESAEEDDDGGSGDDGDDDDDGVIGDNIVFEIDDLDVVGRAGGGPAARTVEEGMRALGLVTRPPEGQQKKHRPPPIQADIDEGVEIEDSSPSPSTTGHHEVASEVTLSPNVLEVDTDENSEADEGWDFSEPFDLIHMRGLKGSFCDWSTIYEEAFKNLSCGGFIEVVDFEILLGEGYGYTPEQRPRFRRLQSLPVPQAPDLPAPSPDPTPPPNSALEHLLTSTRQAAAIAGRPLTVSHLHRSSLTRAGFNSIAITPVDIPLGTWPSDERLRAMGKMWLVCLVEGLEAASLRLLTRAGWSVDDVKRWCERAKTEILRGEHGALVTKMWFVVGRKGRRRA